MLEFGIKDFIDILLVAIILYYVYRVMKQSRSVNIFYGLLLFVTAWIVVSKVLEMKLLGTLLDQLVSVGTIAIIILFQDEIRHFFNNLGAHERAHRFFRFFRPDRKSGDSDLKYDRETIIPIVMACLNMSKQKVGALIVMQNSVPLNDYVNTGDVVDARIGQRIIENIFFKNSPLHDGAMIIHDGRITAAACILPISHDLDMPKQYGLRHRAAKGISQETDALAIVVSEETGHISAAYDNRLRSRLSAEELERILMRGRF
ncbi:MAG: diadenylate cyclase CdaA [Bacteroidaceae bacterium]|nr:diadenylate cyclase CdaA [Bacteroidaceae bacterium]MBQ7988187.1 diadenylate cyclase CdaA [Bacteroidaceae bacterium]